MIDEIIPPIRNDIQLALIEQEGHNYVVMSDRLAYTENEIAISLEFYDLLLSVSGKVKYSELASVLQIDNDLMTEQVISNIKNLDEFGFLYSSAFKNIREEANKEYLSLKNRPYICAESSYPEDVDSLNNFLTELFLSVNSEDYKSNSSAIIVPHIDLRLIKESHQVYASAYHTAKNTDFDLIVILGTAHYDSSSLFMLTEKNYSTPLGIAETDIELVEMLKSNSNGSAVVNEFAHRPEHSIEYQILLSQYYFKGKNFKVLPILVGSFHEFIENNELPDSSDNFANFMDSLRKSIHDLGRKPFFIASVDMAHVGRKFGDDFDAEPMLTNLETADRRLIDSIQNLDRKSFFNIIINDSDKYKICGTSPIYSLLSLQDFTSADFLQYNQWNEFEAKSAVSFASFALYN